MRSMPKWRIIWAGAIILSFAGVSGPSGAAAGPFGPSGRGESLLGLTSIANMGVLVSCGGTKVLIDALFDKPNPEYRAPAPETLDKIMKGEAPFDGVDLVLVTHDHPDHFDAGLAVRFLEARLEPVLLAPADAVEAMRQAAADWPSIGPRVIAIGLEVGEKRGLDVKGIPVTACRTLHSGDRDFPMNLMYLFELDGRRVWHEGDPNGRCEIFGAFGLKDARLDLAVVHYWYPLEPNCARFLQEDLKAGHIALGHLPIRLESDAPGKIDMVRQYYKDLTLLLPGMPARAFGAEPAAADAEDPAAHQAAVIFPDDADAEHGPRFEAFDALEPDRDLALAGDGLGRQAVGNVEEALFFLRGPPRDALLPHLPAVDEDGEGAVGPLVAVVGDDERERGRGIDREVEGEPVRGPAAVAAAHLHGRGLPALHIEVPLGLHLAGLGEGHRGRFELRGGLPRPLSAPPHAPSIPPASGCPSRRRRLDGAGDGTGRDRRPGPGPRPTSGRRRAGLPPV